MQQEPPKMLINCASQAGRTIMRVTEYGIYYMNRAVGCGKSSDGGLRIREGVTNQYSSTGVSGRGRVNLRNIQKGVCGDISGRPLPLRIPSQTGWLIVGRYPLAGPRDRKKGWVSRCQEKSGDNQEPAEQLSFWQQRSSKGKSRC